MSYVNRPPRGQQRDKPYREALRMELAAAGEDMKKLREIARVHIARCEAGDMQAIKELANRLDGKPIEMHETQGLQQLKVISEIVPVNLTPAKINGSSEPLLIEGDGAHNNGGGNGGFEQR
jgi:hypothetical protein